MKPWHEALPETKRFAVFPPLGQERAFAASRERIDAHLRRTFPDLAFEMAEAGLYEEASVMPICGTIGDGRNGTMLAPPSEGRMREIERELAVFGTGSAGLC